jgi:hypothetical protein
MARTVPDLLQPQRERAIFVPGDEVFDFLKGWAP